MSDTLFSQKGLIYLASPYTYEDAGVREYRFQAALAAASEMSRRGLIVFSPIVYNHLMAKVHRLPVHWNFWKTIDEAFLEKADAFAILMMEGWAQSSGIAGELTLARARNLAVYHITLEDLVPDPLRPFGAARFMQYGVYSEPYLNVDTCVPHAVFGSPEECSRWIARIGINYSRHDAAAALSGDNSTGRPLLDKYVIQPLWAQYEARR